MAPSSTGGRQSKSKGGRPAVGRAAERFGAERRALSKIQVHFEFRQSLMRKVRMAAAAENLSYADYVRKVVGLPYAKIQRPRISLSFGAADIALLAERYGKPTGETGILKRCVMEEIGARLDDRAGAEGDSSATSSG